MSDTASSILNAMDEKLDTALGEGTGN